MTFETEYQLQEFRNEQSGLFDENGKAFHHLSHVEPMTRMLALINQMESELLLNKTVVVYKDGSWKEVEKSFEYENDEDYLTTIIIKP